MPPTIETPPLPIDALLPELRRAAQEARRVVLQAEPGAGKTTRVPPALLEAVEGEVLVLEPRRIAARMAATRVAAERGEPVGEGVGYRTRFDRRTSAKTRLTYVTEGLFIRRLLADPTLRGVGAVVLDEFHERSLHSDLALAVLRRLQAERPDLTVVVMSATLHAEPVARFLGDAPVLAAPGRCYPVDVRHLSKPATRPLEVEVRAAVKALCRELPEGDLLVFLPGAAEIRRAQAALEEYARARSLLLLPLHGSMSPAAQDRVLRPADRRKVILATNVAETSVTIDGVRAVVDSGLFRMAGHSPFSGLPTLQLRGISKAQAQQRAGRAGRTAPGLCLRLYTEHELRTRPDHHPPEIRRADLSELLLTTAALGIDPERLPWLEAPPPAALEAARVLLTRLGAIDAGGHLTDRGRDISKLPLHPRLGVLVLEGAARGAPYEAALAAALLAERDVLRGPAAPERSAAPRGEDGQGVPVGDCDLSERIDRIRAARGDEARARSLGLDARGVARVEEAARRLSRAAPVRRAAETAAAAEADRDEGLALALLTAFPDRVAKRRAPRSERFLLTGGGEVTLARESVVKGQPFIVALDAETRGSGAGSRTRVTLARAIEPEWLLDLFPDAVEEAIEVEWNAKAQRVEVFSRLRYGRIVLAESRERAADHPEAARRLAREALRAGLHVAADPKAIEALKERLALARRLDPEAGFPTLDEARIEEAVSRLCTGCSSFAELGRLDLEAALRSLLTPEQARRLEALAPTHIALPGRRRVPVAYPPAAPPYVRAFIQDFFGLRETPCIGGGRVPLQLQLCAPNRRPVQVTQDLAGFWARHYPEIRRQLKRRYPKHRWPEDPLNP
ncbi:MAG: ATP-dependent helicase HrpB [Deltaproteobacteria bacterium]|nr:MAG: ATP-dependent helicase HrpB [Deltaproteobacteria bacterium]